MAGKAAPSKVHLPERPPHRTSPAPEDRGCSLSEPFHGGGGQPPQDVDAVIRQFREAWRRMMPSGGGGSRSILLLSIVFLHALL